MKADRRDFLKTSTVIGLAGITGVASGASLGCNASDVIKGIAAQLPNLAQMALDIAQIVSSAQGRNIMPPVPISVQTAVTDITSRIKAALDELSNSQKTGFIDQYEAAKGTAQDTLKGQIAAVLTKIQADMGNILSMAGIDNAKLRGQVMTIAGVFNTLVLSFLAFPIFAQATAATTATLIGPTKSAPVTSASYKPEDVTAAVLTNIAPGGAYSDLAK